MKSNDEVWPVIVDSFGSGRLSFFVPAAVCSTQNEGVDFAGGEFAGRAWENPNKQFRLCHDTNTACHYELMVTRDRKSSDITP